MKKLNLVPSILKFFILSIPLGLTVYIAGNVIYFAARVLRWLF